MFRPTSSLPRARAVPGLVVALLLVVAPAVARAAAPTPFARAEAESAFVSGDFDGAERAFGPRATAEPRDTLANLRMGQLALMANRLPEAKRWLERARAAGATPTRVANLLAETAYRGGDLRESARQSRLAGRDVRATALDSVAARGAWRIEGPASDTIAFAQTDPLPVVRARVGGRGPYYFLIDTGGGELALDPDLADSLGLPRFGSEMGTFGGGKQKSVDRSRLDRFEIGNFTIHEIPVALLDTKRFAAAAGGRRVVGIIGTIVLDHFRATLDYPGARLVLARRGTTAPEPAKAARERHEIPFRMAGDHFILAPGAIDSSGTKTWFVDTGLAGAAFTAPEETLREAGIALPDTASGMLGQGGGGATRFAFFPIRRLRLGDVTDKDMVGLYGAFPPTLARSLGVRVDGILSHAFLHTWRVTFDFDRMRLVLER